MALFSTSSDQFKKKVMCAQEQDREKIAQGRARWENDQRTIPAAKLVFMDETGTNTQMSRRYGRCAKKQRLIGKAPCGQWKITTFVAALRSKGLTAPMVLDGPLNGESFRAWVRQSLLPTLRPGDVVVMDNLAAHKVSGIRQAIESSGATLFYLPPYSPDLNPIEFAFSKLKSLLRKAAARAVRSLWKTVGNSLRAFTPDECQHFFKAAGYNC
jgi:transposase